MTITKDDLELALIGDLFKFEFPDVGDMVADRMVEGIQLGMRPGPELNIDTTLIRSIATYLIDVEEFGEEVPMEDALKIARFIYGFVQQWQPHAPKEVK